MKCSEICPRKTNCIPQSNIVASDKSTFVCVGLHGIDKEDKLRHCFKTAKTDSMYDYSDYDMISVMSTMSEALMINELSKS